MFAHIIAADVLDARFRLPARRATHEIGARIRHANRSGQTAPAPRAAKVQPIQMRYFAIAPVAYRNWFKQREWLSLGQPRKETREPGAELLLRQHPAHALRLDQAGRQEVFPAGFPCLAVRIA